jgi:hypothetical protein
MRAGQEVAGAVGRGLAMTLARVRYAVKFTHPGGMKSLAKHLSERRANMILDHVADFLDAEDVEAEPVSVRAVD